MSEDTRVVIVTGMSGAGRSSVLKMLEDVGFFCVDNLPVQMIDKFLGFTKTGEMRESRIALGIDIRSGRAIRTLEPEIDELKKQGVEILFMEACTETLVRRYKETRRVHPLAAGGRIRLDEGIELERRRMQFLKDKADYIVDTSRLLVRELKGEIDKIFVKGEAYSNFIITLTSFGFKYGLPPEADFVFDVRFLPNPYYVPELKELTGNDQAVYDYVMAAPAADEFLHKTMDLIEFMIPQFIKEGRSQLTIAVGCTGGRHRSVSMVNALKAGLDTSGYSCKQEHREI